MYGQQCFPYIDLFVDGPPHYQNWPSQIDFLRGFDFVE